MNRKLLNHRKYGPSIRHNKAISQTRALFVENVARLSAVAVATSLPWRRDDPPPGDVTAGRPISAQISGPTKD